ncbi:MAG: ATP-binding protein [Desulfobacterales bacterium]|nr:ATP-binding protein [Desulfobacterales bacterium]
MWLNLSMARALEIIGSPDILYRETIIPAKCPPVSHSPYRPGYDWLFRYEREIARAMSPWTEKHRWELIGNQGVICEALSNAYYHGHGKDGSKPIEVVIYSGEKGLVVQIKDHGRGFHVKAIYEKYNKKKLYYNLAGNGIRLMIHSENFGVFYNHNGTAFHLLHLFNGKMDSLIGGPG